MELMSDTGSCPACESTRVIVHVSSPVHEGLFKVKVLRGGHDVVTAGGTGPDRPHRVRPR